MKKAQLGRIVSNAGKVAKTVDAAADVAKTAKRANAAKKAAKTTTSGMKSFSDDISSAFARMERKALKEKLIAADKATPKKKQLGGTPQPISQTKNKDLRKVRKDIRKDAKQYVRKVKG